MFGSGQTHSAQYKAHIASPEWRAIRKAALERARYRCQLCGLPIARLRAIGRHLEVHHNNYANLGHEQPEDLVVLCAGGTGACHAVADAQRRSHSRRRAARRSRRRRRRRGGGLRGVKRVALWFAFAYGAIAAAPYVLPLLGGH